MEQVESQSKFIDVEGVFKSKNKKLWTIIPGFVFWLIRRLVHEVEINEFLAKHNHLWGKDFNDEVVKHFKVDVNYHGIGHLPKDPKVIIAANHPFGGIEGIVMTKFLYDHYGDVRVPSNDILMSITNFNPLFIPINKHGSNSKISAIEMEKSLNSEVPLLIYPAGMVSRKNNGILRDLSWKKTFLTKSIEYNRPIVPTFVEGHNSKLFYAVAGIRKMLGMKANLEMMLLPHELFRMRGAVINIHFAPAVPPDFFDKRFRAAEWALKLQEYIYLYAQGEKRSFMDVINQSTPHHAKNN
jgi:1-acyl-sn-glycerol-3-phosphate acyltransferase